MQNFSEYSSLITQVGTQIIHSIWFSLCIRFLFLLLFLKVTDIIINKIQTKIAQKADSHEAKKQVVTIFALIRNVIFFIWTTLFTLAFLGKIGIDVQPFLATAGVAGLAVGFASKRFIEDLIQGLIIISSGQIRIGDYVEIAGKSGTVEKIDIKMVTLRSIEGNVHYIRNGLIEIITNYTRDYSVAMLDIGVGYDENPDNVINVLKDIFNNQLKQNPNMKAKIISDIEILGLNELASSSIIIRCLIKTLPKEQWAVQREFNKLILQRFKEENIEIPYPYQNTIIINK